MWLVKRHGFQDAGVHRHGAAVPACTARLAGDLLASGLGALGIPSARWSSFCVEGRAGWADTRACWAIPHLVDFRGVAPSGCAKFVILSSLFFPISIVRVRRGKYAMDPALSPVSASWRVGMWGKDLHLKRPGPRPPAMG